MACNNINPSCDPCSIPPAAWKTICSKYNSMKAYMRELRRYEKRFKRIKSLAQPKYLCTKFKPKPVCMWKREIQIVRPNRKISTRLEQLAMAQLRRLLEVKREFGHRYNRTHINTINKAIRKTIFSLYGRLANVVPPKPKEKPYKWTDKDWRYMRKRLKVLAAPKKVKEPEKIKRKRKALEEFTRTNELAIPKRKPEQEVRTWTYKPSMKNKPGKRIIQLAEPHVRQDVHYKPLGQISKGALKYKASERIVALSTPAQSQKKKDTDLKENPFEISPFALKYKASARITELAMAKEYPKEPDNLNKISPAALKYKATPRIIELAQPKGGAKA